MTQMRIDQPLNGQHPEAPKRRFKAMLSVYCCEPNLSSEPAVGWNMVKEISRYHDVWAIVAEEHRAGIEKEIAVNPLPNVTWIYQDLPHWLTFWKKGERGRRLHYYLWQIAAYRTVKALHKKVKFDVIHHITYVSYWQPSFLSLLNAPFVWGPVGGAESAPHSFYSMLNPRALRHERIRDLIRGAAHNFDPYVRRTAKRARVALATTEETATKMRDLGVKDPRIVPAIALPASEIEDLNNRIGRAAVSPFRVISIGRLIGWKGFELGVRAFAELVKEVPQSEYVICGDGEEREALENLARELGVADKVQFLGLVKRDEAMNKLAQSDVLLHPSLHDSGGQVCIEAMATSRPVICLNLSGPAIQVTDETGIRVPAIDPEQAVRDLAGALKKMAYDPEMRQQMGVSGRQRVWDEFNWDDKGAKISEIYNEVVRV